MVAKEYGLEIRVCSKDSFPFNTAPCKFAFCAETIDSTQLNPKEPSFEKAKSEIILFNRL